MTPTETHVGIASKLVELNNEERKLSERCRDMKRRVRDLYLDHSLGSSEKIRLLDVVEGHERDISAQRRKLHEQIDALRAGRTEADSA